MSIRTEAVLVVLLVPVLLSIQSEEVDRSPDATTVRDAPGYPVLLTGTTQEDEEKDEREEDGESAVGGVGRESLQPRAGGVRERWKSRVGPSGRVPVNALMRAKAHRDQMAFYGGGTGRSGGGIGPGEWTELGPNNIGGRLRGFLIDSTQPEVFYGGSASGGVFKSIDGGDSWFPLDDFLASLSVGSMAMDPVDTATIYVGTGEIRGVSTAGAGMLVTTDAGASFTQMASTIGWNYVNAIAIDPNDRDHLVVGTNEGIFHSSDRGASWSETYSSDVRDLKFQPESSLTLAAGTPNGEVLTSFDGGLSWNVLLDDSANAGRMFVAFSRTDPGLIYVSAATTNDIWRGDISGALTQVGTDLGVGLDSWKNVLWVDPTDDDQIVVGGLDLYRGTYDDVTGALALTKISNWVKWPASAHADHHVIVEAPGYNGTTNKTVYFTNDGGVYLTRDISTVGNDADYAFGWEAKNTGLAITQFYAGAAGPSGQLVWGGTQDNGTLMFDGQQGIWHQILGGDGFVCAGDPRDQAVMYYESQAGNLKRSVDAGATLVTIENFKATDDAPFNMPYVLDPNDADRMYVAATDVHRCDDVATAADPVFASIFSSTKAATSIAVAPGDSDEIWVGYQGGDLYVSTDATTAAPLFTRVDEGTVSLPDRDVLEVTVDDGSGDVYVAFGGFTSDNLWVTRDKGVTFLQLGAGSLPSLPISDVVLHPTIPGCLFVATDLGIYVSEDGGTTWLTSNEGPANVPVDDLWWSCGQLFAATHGRGIWVARAADVITVPDDYPTIQAAIDAVTTASYSLIQVRPGHYFENLRLQGKEIVLESTGGASATIIEGVATRDATVRFVDGESEQTVFQGFTVIGRDHVGIAISGGSPVIRDCRIIGGHPRVSGGGMRVGGGSSPVIERCEFLCNRTTADGGAVSVVNSTAFFAQCAFASNSARGEGGAFLVRNSTIDLSCCSLAGNTAAAGGSSIRVVDSVVEVDNSILWNANGSEVVETGSVVTIDASDVFGGWTGAGSGNISSDPRFADAADYELRLLPGSPCLDAGDQSLLGNDQDYDLRGGLRVLDCDLLGGAQVNMGAHESIPLPVRPFERIQDAIDRAHSTLGVVAIDPGVYEGNLTIRSKRILMIGTGGAEVTTVHGFSEGRCLTLEGNGRDLTIDGLTLTAGVTTGDGAGVFLDGGRAVIRDCVVAQNSAAGAGGGMFVDGDLELIRCLVDSNSATGDGGGISVHFGDRVRIEQSLVTRNDSAADGDGIFVGDGRSVHLIQTTITDQVDEGLMTIGQVFLSGCIVHGNGLDLRDPGGGATIRYSNVGGITPGVDGNIDADPQFVDPATQDYELGPISPCIDAADNLDISFLHRVDLGRARRFWDVLAVVNTGNSDGLRAVGDMGAYEAGASRWYRLGHAHPGERGKPHLRGTGGWGGEVPALFIRNGRGSANALLFAHIRRGDRAFLGGTMVPAIGSVVTPLRLDGSGEASLTEFLEIPPALPGTNGFGELGPRSFFFQVWIDDPAASEGMSATNALRFDQARD